ncbi:MAG: SsrA-binding protein SmpB [Phycisphaerales bacterium]|jgi:SsrA-binding protein|nr:SsrA-binding protein SmpB [Phycisphaerales bacterium]
MAKGKRQSSQRDGEPAIRNRRARHDYLITDTIECGMQLTGTEVKSLRNGQASLQEGFVRAELDPLQLTLYGVHIAEYTNASSAFQHNPTRPRRLLAHKREIRKLAQAASAKGIAIIPLEIRWVHGRAKLVIGLGTGKRHYDKRQALKAKAHRRDIEQQH